MRRYFYYVTTIAISTFLSSCSAAYWSGASFEGDDMYGTHPTSSSSMSYNQNKTAQEVASSSATSYGYQRPDSYYQYQYVAADGAEGVVMYDPSTYTADQAATKSVVVIDPKYASSTYGVWEEEPSVASNVYVNVSYGYSSYNPWWGWGYGYYDPFFYSDWRYPHYYSHYYSHYHPYYDNWWWHRPRPIYVSKRPKQNIVHLPSSGGGSSTRYQSSKSYRGQSVGTTTSGKFSRASTMFNTNNNSSSSSSKSSSSSSSSSKTQSSSSSSSSSRSSTYTAPVRPSTTTTPSTSSPTRSYSTPSSSSSSGSSSSSSSRSSSGGGSSSR
ncbi:MAG: hypothetical protein SNG02_08200 [Rikenellaceae bacterium]